MKEFAVEDPGDDCGDGGRHQKAAFTNWTILVSGCWDRRRSSQYGTKRIGERIDWFTVLLGWSAYHNMKIIDIWFKKKMIEKKFTKPFLFWYQGKLRKLLRELQLQRTLKMYYQLQINNKWPKKRWQYTFYIRGYKINTTVWGSSPILIYFRLVLDWRGKKTKKS